MFSAVTFPGFSPFLFFLSQIALKEGKIFPDISLFGEVRQIELNFAGFERIEVLLTGTLIALSTG